MDIGTKTDKFLDDMDGIDSLIIIKINNTTGRIQFLLTGDEITVTTMRTISDKLRQQADEQEREVQEVLAN